MSRHKYEPWEEELEAPELDEEARTVIPMMFAAIIGISIFALLLCRSLVQKFLKTHSEAMRQNRPFGKLDSSREESLNRGF
jgi:hypothetical protein